MGDSKSFVTARYETVFYKLEFANPMNAPYFSCFGKKSTKRSRHRGGANAVLPHDKCTLPYVPHLRATKILRDVLTT